LKADIDPDWKQSYRERRDETAQERRQYALEQGTRTQYLTCPLCGRNRPLKDSTRFEVKPDYALVQTRAGGGEIMTQHGGMSVGWWLVEDESLSMEEVREQYPEVWANLIEEVGRLQGAVKAVEEG